MEVKPSQPGRGELGFRGEEERPLRAGQERTQASQVLDFLFDLLADIIKHKRGCVLEAHFHFLTLCAVY